MTNLFDANWAVLQSIWLILALSILPEICLEFTLQQCKESAGLIRQVAH